VSAPNWLAPKTLGKTVSPSAPLTHPVLAHLLPALVLNSVIALGITVFGEHGFADNWVYSQCIGLSIGVLIHQASRWFIADWATQWRRIVLIVPVGAVVGLVLGSLLGDQLVNGHSMGYWARDPRKAWGFLALSLVAGAALTYFFVSRAQLAKERERAEAALRHAAESRLKLLETQLEPHMLFNTLANLHALIGTDPTRAQHMLDRLVSYLRATLSGSRASQHSLQAEFDLLRDYLELMSVRMGPRLQFTLLLPPDLALMPVPPLLLQPLVENAIQHGLEPQVAGGHITVQARRNGTQLTVEVTDTGAGLAELPASHDGFGLAQIRARLAATHGDKSALELIAAPAVGTLARVTFPC
jgi:signal transduction histidine kinase